MSDAIIGIDAGTSVIKSVAFSVTGEQLAAFALPNRYDSVPGGGAEQDVARTWTDCAASLRGLGEELPDLAARTRAIAVTGQGDGTWLIDAAGEPVTPAWLWLDARAADLADDLRADPGDRARFATTGTGLAACQQGPQLAWMKRHRPEPLAAAATAFHCKDWLYYKLCGRRATDPTEGIFTYGDHRTLAYAPDVIDFLGLSDLAHLFPDVIDGMRQHDALTQSAAAETGLKAGTPVVLGYVDVICTALGAGLYERAGDMGCSIVGSTGMHMRLVPSVEQVTLNAAATGYTMAFPVPGHRAQMQSNLAATLNIDWMLDLGLEILADAGIERGRADLIAGLDERVLAAAPAALLFQPYISEAGERGPFVDANARAGFLGLCARHGYGDLMRAVYEGLAFAARDCYGAMGGPPAEVRLTGGAARSQAIRRILGSVLGARVRTSGREEAGAAGVAMMAAVRLGLYPDMARCAEDWVTPLLGEAEAPDPDLTRRYAETYPLHVEARRQVAPLWRGLAASRGQGS